MAGFDWKSSLAPVKNTFIHFQEEAEEFLLPQSTLRRSLSGPALLEGVELPLPEKAMDDDADRSTCASSPGSGNTSPSARSRYPSAATTPDDFLQEKVLAHNLGKCRPCGYFYSKADGCRQGDACEYCHLCTEEDVKERKRSCKKRARAAKRAAACIAKAEARAAASAESEARVTVWADA
eukprot:TRINITY_DN6823_c0_g1_i3.p1 TRINITY_DN6823_c0_g1~~TRINITY_DN6823_c0_g1_i3.p1  ORF type:complete len:180 (+),score=45.31 TRINITY_DN6823_c0_g1_i3:73-612(+)